MAETRLSSISDSVQPICEECGIDECDVSDQGRGALDDDRQPYLGYDSR